MFYCVIHNWYSQEEPCPACHPVVTVTTTDCVINSDGTGDAKRDWEIVKCIDCGGNIHDHYSTERAKLCGVPSCETQGCKIHSVKRLSDGEVFSVGDEVLVDCSIKKITKIHHHTDGQLLVVLDGVNTLSEKGRMSDIRKKPTFTPQSGEYVTLEECERRERRVFEWTRNRFQAMILAPYDGNAKYPKFEDYKQSIKS